MTENADSVLDIDLPFPQAVDDPSEHSITQAFQNMKQYIGKVMTSLRVFNTRIPPEFLQFYTQISALDQKLELPKEISMLIRLQVSSCERAFIQHDKHRLEHTF